MTSGTRLFVPSRSRLRVPPHAGATRPAAAAVEVAVHGVWSHTLGLHVSAALRECLADRPGAVIVDLHGLTDDHAASLPLWLAARRAGTALRPRVRLALCLAPATLLQERLQRIGARRLPMYLTMAEARAATANPPPG